MYDSWSQPAGSDFVRKRRQLVSKASWDVPDGWDEGGSSQPQETASVGAPADSSGDPWLRTMQNLVMQNTAARTAGARGSALRASPNDPSLASYAQLEGQLRGQSDASGQMAQATNSWLGQRDMQAFEEEMLRMKMEYEMKMAKMQANAQMWSSVGQGVGQLGGAAIGKWG
jgi:hypothetical protein